MDSSGQVLRVAAGDDCAPASWSLRACSPAASARKSKFLPYDFCRVGIALRSEFLHASCEYFGDVQIALLVDREGVRSLELAGQSARAAPAIEIVAIQIILED